MTTALPLLLIVALAGCTTASMRRDLDVTGSLPRAIGLGAFAPTCFLLCFTSNEIHQGNVAHEDDIARDDLTIRSSTRRELNVPPPQPKE